MAALSDREEGEIVDDYEYILSSDEDNVRQRIQELEAKNYELEQIAQISGVYSNAYNGSSRNGHIPTDVSSISSVDFDSPVRKSHKLRRKEFHKRKHNRRSRSRHYNRHKHHSLDDEEDHLTRLRAKITEELDTISVESDAEHITTTTHNKEEILSYASRAKLRLAVNRHANGFKKNTALKERLLKESTNLPKEHAEDIVVEKSKVVEEEDSLSADEQELRLIALKSAVMNKHMARKQRNAEVPYSPTDFDDLLANEESLNIDDNMELELPDLAVGMDISPTISPDVTTPTSPVDMDIAQSDSDIEDVATSPPPAFPPPPPPPPINDNWQSYSNMEYPAAMHYGIYMPEMQYQQPPPPPPPPLPPLPATSPTKQVIISNDNNVDEEDEEEALRALLLSKINSAKTQEKAKVESLPKNKDDNIENELEVVQAESEETPTALILKQAVLRLRQKTTTPTELETIEVEKVEHRPKIMIRSVSEINREFEKQRMQELTEVIEINSTMEEIITLSDSEDEEHISLAVNKQNKRALSDINCNINERPNLIVVPINKAIKQKTNIPSIESEVGKKKTQQKAVAETVVKRKNIATNKINKRIKITPRKNKTEEAQKEKNRRQEILTKTTPKKNDENNVVTKVADISTVDKNNVVTEVQNKESLENNTTVEIQKEESLTSLPTQLDLPTIEVTTAPSLLKNKEVVSKVSPKNRLITITPKIQVPKMIISLNNSESDESDCPDTERCASMLSLDTSDMDFHNYDNASPISLPMDSPANGTSRCVSPSNEATETNERLPTRTVVNDIFQQRLDDFLKTARTTISVNTKTTKTSTANSTQEKQVVSSSTPMALRHLPVSAQQEYRRLIMRMKMLEEQKHKKLGNEQTVETAAVTTTKSATPSTVAFVSANKKTLIKKVLVKNANNTSPNNLATTSKFSYNNKANNTNKNNLQETKSVAKVNALQTYEKSYEKLGGVIVMKLGKSLQHVEEARKAKINKFLYEEEVRKLKLQLRLAQQNLNQAQSTIQQVFPMISSTNQLISTLKRRRMKLYKAATVLGKTIKGDDYSLKNVVKEEVCKKSEKLALAIKEVNTIKSNNFNIKQQKSTATITSVKTLDQATMTDDITSMEIENKSKEADLEGMCEENTNSVTSDSQVEELRPYLTPLSDRDTNIATILPSDAVLCPYDLSGNCQDTNCRHVHLNDLCV